MLRPILRHQLKLAPSRRLLSTSKSLDDLAASLFSNTTPSSATTSTATPIPTTPTTTPIHTTITTPVAIIGSGPAAWTAAIYTSRAGLKPIVLEGSLANGIAAGGQLTTTTDVENYPGFPTGIQGPELTELFRQHGQNFGAKSLLETVGRVDVKNKIVWTDSGTRIHCKAMIIATGTM